MQHKFLNTDANDLSGGGLPSDVAMKNEQMNRINQEAQTVLRDLRVRIDSFYLTAQYLPASREISLAITSFQRSRQNLGICLGEKGAAYPYNNQEAKQRTEKGEPLQDVLEIKENELAALNKFRELVSDCITDLEVYLENYTPNSMKDVTCSNVAFAELIQGRIWLGEVIGKLVSQ